MRLVLSLIAVMLSSCGPPAGGTIAITDDPRFFPARLYVNRGSEVEWVNDSSDTRVIASIQVPRYGEPFASPPLAPGQSWTYTFPEPGFYRYGEAITGAGSVSGIIVVR